MHIPVNEVQIKLMKKKKLKITSLTHYPFSLRKFIGLKRYFLRRRILNGKCWHLLSVRKSLGILRNFFQRYISVAMQNPCRLPFLAVDWNLISQRGVSKEKSWKIFILFKLTSFEPWGIYKYQIIKQGYLGTEYTLGGNNDRRLIILIKIIID